MEISFQDAAQRHWDDAELLELEDRDRWIHVEALWPEYQIFASGRRGQRYLSPLSRFTDNPFADWNVTQRYAAANATPKGAALETHRKAARACLVALQRACQDQ